MKKLFGIVLTILIVAWVYTNNSLTEVRNDIPVLYWVTDSNPARVEQIRTFQKWMKETYPEAEEVEIRVDTANSAPEKILIQGVSGVCGDLIDHSGGGNMRFRRSIGLFVDVTEDAKKMGFDPSQTWPAIEAEITAPVLVKDADGNADYENRQFVFPCNVFAEQLWVNNEAFERLGMAPPPKRWTIEEFEKIGYEFVTKANASESRLQRTFFMADAQPLPLARSMGGTLFNETQTAPYCNSEAMRKAFDLRYRWMHEMTPRLIPTAAERNSFSASTGYGGAGVALFARGNYALLLSGRYMLIQFRRITEERLAEGKGPLRLGVSEMPHAEMPVATTGTRATGVYVAGKHAELAKYFLAYLASEAYNMNIVNDADALPPNPKYTEIEEFLYPKDHPEEWDTENREWSVHKSFSDAMKTISVPNDFSPFVIDDVANRLFNQAQDAHINKAKTSEQALADLDELLRDEIERTLKENPELVPMYEERVETQKKIDALRAAGEKVPLSWITNPYLRRWYVFKGWADEEK